MLTEFARKNREKEQRSDGSASECRTAKQGRDPAVVAAIVLAFFIVTGLGQAEEQMEREPSAAERSREQGVMHRGRHGPGAGMRARRAGRPPRDRRGHRHGAGFMRRLRDLPPEEQERVLANDERFRRLPPERQKMIRERLRQWSALSPEEKERIRERQEIFSNLSPAQRQEARALFRQWRLLPPERQRELMPAFRRLRDLPSVERGPFLSSPEIKKSFSSEERELLAGLSRLLSEGSHGPPGEPVEPNE